MKRFQRCLLQSFEGFPLGSDVPFPPILCAPDAIHAVDISLSDFDSNTFGLNEDDVHRELHGIKPDGGVTVGMDSVREAYRVIGLGYMLSFTAWWPFRPVSDWMYRRFAANRLKIGSWFGREDCSTNTCKTSSTPPEG